MRFSFALAFSFLVSWSALAASVQKDEPVEKADSAVQKDAEQKNTEQKNDEQKNDALPVEKADSTVQKDAEQKNTEQKNDEQKNDALPVEKADSAVQKDAEQKNTELKDTELKGDALPAEASTSTAPKGQPKKKQCEVVVMNLKPRGLPKEQEYVAEILTNALAAEIVASSDCKVVTEVDIKSMLDFESSRIECGSVAESCMAEIGNALGVDLVIAGVVSKLGEEYTLQAQLSNIAEGRVDGRYDATVVGSPSLLKNAAKNAGRVLFQKKAIYNIEGTAVVQEEAEPPGEPFSSLSFGIWVASGGVLLGAAGLGLAVGMEAMLRTEVSENHQAYQYLGYGGLAGAVAGGVALAVGAGFSTVGLFE